ncbi:MAG: hypothetical protein DME04_15210 [Candidatus Rokuibacteriota bacterium]|nr:MAG: hypothetical protein DME04_15210 [Candidatus Rokubacteria bacterium]
MAGAVLALLVLVMLPLAFLVWGSVTTGDGVTLAHFRDALSSRLYLTALRNSLVLGLWTAVLSIAIGLPLAWVVSRTNAPARRFVHLSAVVSYLTPPFLTDRVREPVQPERGPGQPLRPRRARAGRADLQRLLDGRPRPRHRAPHVPVRVPAHGERPRVGRRVHGGVYVPLGVRSANAAFRQIDPSLEETARVTGAGWLRTFTAVTLPLARPGLFAGWLLVFVPALQELSASILLFSSGSITLAVAVYNLYETGALEPVAALAIVTMLIITAAIALAGRLGRGSASVPRRGTGLESAQ